MGRRRQTLPLWQALLIGPVLIALGIWEYRDLSAFEARGGTMYVSRVTAFFYRIGGKTTVLAVMVGIGVVYILMLAYWWRTTRAAEKKLAAMDQDIGADLLPPPKERPMRKRGDDLPPPPAGPSDAGPFRGAGASAPVQVIRTERPVSRPAVVPVGGEDHGPKILR